MGMEGHERGTERAQRWAQRGRLGYNCYSGVWRGCRGVDKGCGDHGAG